MDDLRVLWIRDRVYKALGLTDPQLFEELLYRNDGEVEELILHFLNQTSHEEGAATLFFYRTVVPEEVLVETGEPAAAPPARSLRPTPAGLSLGLGLRCRPQMFLVPAPGRVRPGPGRAWRHRRLCLLGKSALE